MFLFKMFKDYEFLVFLYVIRINLDRGREEWDDFWGIVGIFMFGCFLDVYFFTFILMIVVFY